VFIDKQFDVEAKLNLEGMMLKTKLNYKQSLMKLKPLLNPTVKSPRIGLETHRAYG